MATAGFWAIETRKITFGRDGEWYSDGERIVNPRIAALFSRSVQRRKDGGYELRVGDERADIEVEDTAWVVRQIEGSSSQGFGLLLNDGTRERLDPASLRISEDGVLYCSVKNGTEQARLLRPAYYALADWIAPAEDGTFVLECAGARAPVLRRR